jgi:hypothetical protein
MGVVMSPRAGASAGTGHSCGHRGRWFNGASPVVTLGKRVEPGAVARVYLVEQGATIALEVTHPGRSASHVAGTITTDGGFAVAAFKDESDDTRQISHQGHTLSCNFVKYRFLDGLVVTHTAATSPSGRPRQRARPRA